jgi:membrane fusion protein
MQDVIPPPVAPARDDPLPFLILHAPHWAAHGLAYVLLLLGVAGVCIALVLRIPDTVSSPFVLLPVRGTDPIRAPRGGLIAAVRAADGDTINQRDALFVIQSTAVGERSAALETLTAQLRGLEESLVNERSKYENQQRATAEESRRLQARLAHLSRTVDAKGQELAWADEAAEGYRRLQERGLVSRLEYTSRQLAATRAAVELDRAQTERAELVNTLEKLRHEAAASQAAYQELRRRLQEEREKASIRRAALQQDLIQSQGNQLSVPAACAGTMLRRRVQGVGAVVQEGEVLAELACAGERLQAELTVPQAALGRIQPGLGVKLLYEAFPYQRYGVRYGTVRWVSPSSVLVNDTPVFRVLVDIVDDAILVQGQPRPLMAGMRGKAEVVVGRTSVLGYVFAPLRQLREALADAPARPVSGHPQGRGAPYGSAP